MTDWQFFGPCFDHGQRIARLAADGAHMGAVDAIAVQLVQAEAADRIVGHAGQQRRPAPCRVKATAMLADDPPSAAVNCVASSIRVPGGSA